MADHGSGFGGVGDGDDAGGPGNVGGNDSSVAGVLWSGNVTDAVRGKWQKPWWWFSLGREDGQPAYYPDNFIPFPDFLWHSDLITCAFLFGVPIVAFFILLPSFRNKHWSTFAVIMLCLVTGFLMFLTYFSSGWLVGTVNVLMATGPLRRPIRGQLGIFAGLWHANLTYTTQNIFINEQVSWTQMTCMHTVHRDALRKGWVYPLLSLTAELSGESRAWHGMLGTGLRNAGFTCAYFMVAAIATWLLWVALFTIAPERTAQLLMVTGVLLNAAALAFVFYVYCHMPDMIRVHEGAHLDLHLGWAWYTVCILGVALVLVGTIVRVYSYRNPYKLSTIFEVDSGTPYDRLYLSNIPSQKDDKNTYEDYVKIYPPCYLKSQLVTEELNAYYPDGNNNLGKCSEVEKGHPCVQSRVVRQYTNKTLGTGRLIFYNKINIEPPNDDAIDDIPLHDDTAAGIEKRAISTPLTRDIKSLRQRVLSPTASEVPSVPIIWCPDQKKYIYVL